MNSGALNQNIKMAHKKKSLINIRLFIEEDLILWKVLFHMVDIFRVTG